MIYCLLAEDEVKMEVIIEKIALKIPNLDPPCNKSKV